MSNLKLVRSMLWMHNNLKMPKAMSVSISPVSSSQSRYVIRHHTVSPSFIRFSGMCRVRVDLAASSLIPCRFCLDGSTTSLRLTDSFKCRWMRVDASCFNLLFYIFQSVYPPYDGGISIGINAQHGKNIQRHRV